MLRFVTTMAVVGGAIGGVVVATAASPIAVATIAVGVASTAVATIAVATINGGTSTNDEKKMNSDAKNRKLRQTEIPVAKPVEEKPKLPPELEEIMSFAGNDFTFLTQCEGFLGLDSGFLKGKQKKKLAMMDRLNEDQTKYFHTFRLHDQKIYGVYEGNEELVAMSTGRRRNGRPEMRIFDPVSKLLKLLHKEIKIVENARCCYGSKSTYVHQLLAENIDYGGLKLRSIYYYDGFLYGFDGCATKVLRANNNYAWPSLLLQLLTAYFVTIIVLIVVINHCGTAPSISIRNIVLSKTHLTPLAILAIAYTSHAVNCLQNQWINKQRMEKVMGIHGIREFGTLDELLRCCNTFDALIHHVSYGSVFLGPVFFEMNFCGYNVLTLHSRYADKHITMVQFFGLLFTYEATLLMAYLTLYAAIMTTVCSRYCWLC